MLKKGLIEYRRREYDAGDGRISHAAVLKVLKKDFNFRTFKSEDQELLVLKTLAGESVFGIMATGSGKSLAFLLPPFLQRKLRVCLVVSPLKALMSQFDEKHDWVKTIHTDVEVRQRKNIWRQIREGKVHVLLVAPERLKNDVFKERLIEAVRRGGRELGPLVLDEVHCVTDWGRDFRPEYWWAAEHLADIERRLGAKRPIPKVLLTATADDRVRQEVLARFGFRGRGVLSPANIIQGPVPRPEIFIAAIKCRTPEKKHDVARKFLERQAKRPLPAGVKRRALVYNFEAVKGDIGCAEITAENAHIYRKEHRLKANQLAKLLKLQSSKTCRIRALPYASTGMNQKERARTEKFFKAAKSAEGEIRVVVATSAFGMGMDYDKIPAVLHFDPRASLGEYWQQVGRAGRNFELAKGEWAEGLAVYTPKDLDRASWRASPPALDGIINAFTILALALLVAWDLAPGSQSVALKTPTGRKSKFARFLGFLQEKGILGPQRRLRVFGDDFGAAWGFPVNHRALKRAAGSLNAEVRRHGYKTTHYRKYVRYLRVAAQSKPGEYVLLDQGDYALDRHQTVLSRVTRWADIGALERTYSARGRPLTVTFRVKKRRLTRHLVERITEEWDVWAEVKRRDFEKHAKALEAGDHQRIVALIHKTFGGGAKPRPISDYENAGDRVPRWLGGLAPAAYERIKRKRHKISRAATATRKEQYAGHPAAAAEGPAHLELKERIAREPSLIGINAVDEAIIEYEFPSGDRADIVFRCKGGRYSIVEVEMVDARVAVFQMVKYKALLCAKLREPLDSDLVEAVLVAPFISPEIKEFASQYMIKCLRTSTIN